MSDRQSAYIFGRIFTQLAKGDVTDRDREHAQAFWPLRKECDFSDDQMCLDRRTINNLFLPVEEKEE